MAYIYQAVHQPLPYEGDAGHLPIPTAAGATHPIGSGTRDDRSDAASRGEIKTFPSFPTIPVKTSLKSLSLGVFLMSLVSAFALILLLVVIVVYIAGVHHAEIQHSGLRVLTTADSTRVLAITQVTGKFVAVMVAPIMAIHAYVVAGEWLRASRSVGAAGRPTPIQLGLTMSVIGSANIIALFRGLNFLGGITKTSRAHRSGLSLPSFLTRSIFLLLWLLVLEYFVAIVDTALHVTAVSRLVPAGLGSSGPTAEKTMVGRVLNQTKCEEWRQQHNSTTFTYPGRSCGLLDGSNNADYLSQPDGIRTLSNTSNTTSVAWLSDSSAILIPASLPTFAYEAEALALKATCESITKQCANCTAANAERPYASCQGSEASLTLSCRGPALYNATSLEGGPLSPVNGSTILGLNVASNPFSYGDVVTSFAYFDATTTDDEYVRDTGFVIHGHSGGWNVIFCSVGVSSVTYSFYPPSTFTLLTSTPSDLHTTQVIAQTVTQSNRVALAVEGAGYANGNYADAYARQLAKNSMGFATVMLMPKAATRVMGADKLGSDFSLIVFLLFGVLVVLFAITILSIGIHAALSITRSSDPGIKPVRERFLSPYALLEQIYGRPNPEPGAMMTSNGLKLFSPEGDGDRLAVGPRFEQGVWRMAAVRE